MFKRTKLSTAALLALGGLATLVAVPAAAQDTQRIEITGSAVRRIQSEGALPVQVITRQEIDKSGATSVSELIQTLPSMQNFTNEGTSVGGGGNGFSGASIHNLGETRTLVLLNGRRLAMFAGQYLTGALAGIDLNTIPIAALERVEILTDGASALYGADAVGGVVNFITRKEFRGVELGAGFTSPEKGAKERRASIAGGFGDLDRDRFSFLASASVEKRTKLNGTDREFSKTGIIPFNIGGRDVLFFNGSPRGIPANITHDAGTPGDGRDDYLVSPYFAQNGSCPAVHVALQEGPGGTACYYDFATNLEILPERDRSALFLQGRFKLAQDHVLFAEFLRSSTKNTNRIAPPPGEVTIGPSSPFWSFVLEGNPLQTQATVVPYRVADVGKRTQTDKTDAEHFVVGAEGLLGGWDYNLSYTHSVNKQATSLGGGYVFLNAFFDALDSGLVNPFVAPGNQSPAAQQALNDARILGFWEGGKSNLDVWQVKASKELMPLAGGSLAFAAGASHMKEKFSKIASETAQGLGPDQRFGDTAAIVPSPSWWPRWPSRLSCRLQRGTTATRTSAVPPRPRAPSSSRRRRNCCCVARTALVSRRQPFRRSMPHARSLVSRQATTPALMHCRISRPPWVPTAQSATCSTTCSRPVIWRSSLRSRNSGRWASASSRMSLSHLALTCGR
jgi:iron complex outermembrane recepter protein